MAKEKKPEVVINWKYYWMSAAEIIDAFRGVPRAMVLGYAYLVWHVVDWFMSLSAPSTEHTFLVSTVVGGAAAVFGLYVNSGSGWDRKSARKDLYIEHHNPGFEAPHMPTIRKHRGTATPTRPVFDEIEFDFEEASGGQGFDETPPDDFLKRSTD